MGRTPRGIDEAYGTAPAPIFGVRPAYCQESELACCFGSQWGNTDVSHAFRFACDPENGLVRRYKF